MLPQAHRLKASRDFDTAYKKGSHRKGRYGKLVCLDRGDKDPTRVGIVVSAKTGNAVVRNKTKRVIREAFREHLADMKSGFDITYIVWDPAFSFNEISGEVMKLMKGAGVTAS